MSRLNDQNKLARKVAITYHKDGLVDIVAGAAIMGLGAWYFNASTVVAFLSLLPFIFFARLKNWITAPRVRMMKIDPVATASRTAFGGVIILSAALVIVTGFSILGNAGSIALFTQPIPALVLVTALLLAVIGTGISARSGGIPIFWYARVILYAAIYLLVIVGDIGFRITNAPVVVAVGAIILILGIGQLLVFLSRNPISRPEEL